MFEGSPCALAREGAVLLGELRSAPEGSSRLASLLGLKVQHDTLHKAGAKPQCAADCSSGSQGAGAANAPGPEHITLSLPAGVAYTTAMPATQRLLVNYGGDHALANIQARTRTAQLEAASSNGTH